jgi:hypothetical protein
MESSEYSSGSAQEEIIVLVDGADNYYELPRQLLESTRVPASQEDDVKQKLEDVPSVFDHISISNIPGSTATAEFAGGRQLHYAGHYLRPSGTGS